MPRGWIASDMTPSLSPTVVPGGSITDGDILLDISFTDAANATPALPAGFTAFTGMPESSTFDGLTLMAGWKKAASESGNYVSTDTHNMVAVVCTLTGEDATLFLHRQSSQASSTGDPDAWDIISPAFSSITAAICDIIFVGISDNNPGGDVVHTPPAGFSTWLDFGNSGFFNGFIATKLAAAAGETGAYTGQGSLGGAIAGYAALAVALQNAAGGGAQNQLAWVTA